MSWSLCQVSYVRSFTSSRLGSYFAPDLSTHLHLEQWFQWFAATFFRLCTWSFHRSSLSDYTKYHSVRNTFSVRRFLQAWVATWWFLSIADLSPHQNGFRNGSRPWCWKQFEQYPEEPLLTRLLENTAWEQPMELSSCSALLPTGLGCQKSYHNAQGFVDTSIAQ